MKFAKIVKLAELYYLRSLKYLHKILVCKHLMVVSISLLRKHIPVLDGPIESKLISGRKRPYESLDKCGNAAAAKEKSVAEEPVKEKKDRVYSVIITIITNSKL